jgi:hypothetical protein
MILEDRRRFVWWYGVVRFGLPAGIIVAVAMSWFRPLEGRSLRGFWFYIAALPIWLLAGYFWGITMWKWMKRRRESESQRG